MKKKKSDIHWINFTEIVIISLLINGFKAYFSSNIQNKQNDEHTIDKAIQKQYRCRVEREETQKQTNNGRPLFF